MRKMLNYIPSWEWFFLFAVLVLLTLFVLGHDWFGLNAHISALYALGGAVASTLIAFLMAALILPLIGLVSSILAGAIAAVGIIVATLITPIVALGAGLFTTVVTWLAGTWVGVLFSPVYGMIAPILLKISPLLTLGKWGHKLYDWLDDQPWWPQKLVFTANKRIEKLAAEVRKGIKEARKAPPRKSGAARKPRR